MNDNSNLIQHLAYDPDFDDFTIEELETLVEYISTLDKNIK